MIYFSLQEVLAFHDRILERFGGRSGVRDMGLLESALEQPMLTVFGQELHPTPELKAAAYLYHLAQNHPFVDGNKRTAYTAIALFLRVNGFHLKAAEDELFDLTLAVANGQMEKEEIAVWVVAHRIG